MTHQDLAEFYLPEDTRIKKMARLFRISKAMEDGDLLTIIEASGLPSHLAETMDYEDVINAINIRVFNLTQDLGIHLESEQS